ncbi:MAG: hypothetical protein PHT94_01140 [Candidatus Nanoarchaeia archaeon]|nr:hypothetical protein [Candidatus Nanoarchaeia archaeon]
MNKKQVPQLNNIGVSYDYNNFLGGLCGALELILKDEDWYRSYMGLSNSEYILKKTPFITYKEAYPHERFEYKDTFEIDEVENLSKQIKKLIQEESTDFSQMYKLIDGISLIVNDEKNK